MKSQTTTTTTIPLEEELPSSTIIKKLSKDKKKYLYPHDNDNDNDNDFNIKEKTPFIITDSIRKHIIELQPTLNIGTIGHVAHGKSTLVHAISGVKTAKSKKEKERNMTIHLGYANAKIFKCPVCPRPQCYQPFPSKQKSTSAKCRNFNCNESLILERHISFIDCPGHEVLMATMLNGAASFHAALLIIAANEKVPAPQTAEHLAAADMLRLPNVLTIQNKLDLIDEDTALSHSIDIKEFISGTVADGSPIIPVSASAKANIDYVCMYICEQIPEPPICIKEPARLDVLRSFDINKPGIHPSDLKGAVLGGTLKRGKLSINDEIELRPGLVKRTENGLCCFPLRTRVISISSEQNKLEYAIPGGLIGIGTTLDPSLSRNNGLVGNVIGIIGTLPDVFHKLALSVRLMKRIVGIEDYNSEVTPFLKGENILLNIGSSTVNATVTSYSKRNLKVSLENPVCAEISQVVSISRFINRQYRLVGDGKVRKGSLKIRIASYDEYEIAELG